MSSSALADGFGRAWDGFENATGYMEAIGVDAAMRARIKDALAAESG